MFYHKSWFLNVCAYKQGVRHASNIGNSQLESNLESTNSTWNPRIQLRIQESNFESTNPTSNSRIQVRILESSFESTNTVSNPRTQLRIHEFSNPNPYMIGFVRLVWKSATIVNVAWSELEVLRDVQRGVSCESIVPSAAPTVPGWNGKGFFKESSCHELMQTRLYCCGNFPGQANPFNSREWKVLVCSFRFVLLASKRTPVHAPTDSCFA